MSNVAITRDKGPTRPLVSTRDWDPFRVMRELFRWDPFAEMAPIAAGQEAFAPAFEVKETNENFEFSADLPGVKESDLDVKLTQNRLTISGKRESEKSDKGETYYTYERSFGSFTRAFALPEGVDPDKIQAQLKDGVLRIVVPKKPEAGPKKVAVKAG